MANTIHDTDIHPALDPREAVIETICQHLGIKTEMGRAAIREVLPLMQLMDRKQQDYGSSNISINGELGVMVRCQDKVSRLKNLLGKELRGETDVNNEGIEDSWSDLANYGVIGLLLRKGVWR